MSNETKEPRFRPNIPGFLTDTSDPDHDPMFDKIVDWNNVKEAYQSTQKGVPRLKIPALLFKEDYISNLRDLRTEVIHDDYTHKGYVKFLVRDPKERVIYAPTYRDKVVQHMINNVLRDVYEPCFIYDSYACIRNKGNQKAVKRIQHFQISSKDVYKEPYFLKLDVSKFFYTIDRDVLKAILKKKITGKKTLYLLDQIIDSFHEPLGLPLGNLTSQLFANIYLNEIDHIIKRRYKVRYYVRYADDMFLIVEGKERAMYLKDKLIEDINNILKLTINPKKINISKANKINGLGFTIRPDGITPLGKNKRRLRYLALENDPASINSWYGYASISQCHGLIYESIANTDILFVNNKFVPVFKLAS